MDPFSKKNLNYRSYINTVRGLYENPSAQTSTALIFTMVTIVFFGLAAIRPTLATISELQAELKEKREIETQLTEKINKLSLLQQEYQENEQVLGVFDSAIPNQQDFEKLLMQIEYIAAVNQTPLRNIRTTDVTTLGEPTEEDEKEEPSDFSSIRISVTANGSYEELTALLDRFNTFNRYVTIETISFSQPTEEDADYELSMNVSLLAYWLSTLQVESFQEPNSL